MANNLEEVSVDPPTTPCGGTVHVTVKYTGGGKLTISCSDGCEHDPKHKNLPDKQIGAETFDLTITCGKEPHEHPKRCKLSFKLFASLDTARVTVTD